MTGSSARQRPRMAAVIAIAASLGSAAWFARAGHGSLTDPLTPALAAGALVANLISARYSRGLWISASFTCSMLAVAFLGPAPAFAVAVVGELGAWAVERYGLTALSINVAGSALPNVLAAAAFAELVADPRHSDGTIAPALALVSAGALALNFGLVAWLTALRDGERLRARLAPLSALAPTLALNVALTISIAEIYRETGLAAAVLLLLVVIGFTYMSRLLVLARERTRQYASLSWGVLSGLLRTLDIRDGRAARHSAATAVFARDIAKACGMSSRECELAHTAGLLHDIGKFALSDRVMERGGVLTEADWEGIRRHPALGAEMLRDLGVYGPVAEIVRAHHERLDGRGYPDGVGADEIPEIAKIVAVAEVYDTLTAEDTYRTPMNSFEALTELRRVSGSQLDGRYVEALAELLAGRGTEYRHADAADFDRELEIERRINEAAAP